MVTVGARSWLIQLRRKAFEFEITQLHRDARRHVADWINAHQRKQSHYAHLVAAPADGGASTASYRKSREAARRAVLTLDRRTGRDDLRNAVHNVGVAEQAAKARRKKVLDVLDPVFAGWLGAIVSDVTRYKGNLPSQVGIPDWDPVKTKAEEAGLASVAKAGPLIEQFLTDEKPWLANWPISTCWCVRSSTHQRSPRSGSPMCCHGACAGRGLICAVSASAIWVTEALTRWIFTGSPGTFFQDVLNNVLCALAIAVAGISVAAYVHHVARTQQAKEAQRPVAEFFDATSSAMAILNIAPDSELERCLITRATSGELYHEVRRTRVALETLHGIRPDQ